jgi:hypothetical protein
VDPKRFGANPLGHCRPEGCRGLFGNETLYSSGQDAEVRNCSQQAKLKLTKSCVNSVGRCHELGSLPSSRRSTFCVVLKIRPDSRLQFNRSGCKEAESLATRMHFIPEGRQAMKSQKREAGIRDRISTRQELGQVIVQLVEMHQLSFDDTLESLELPEEHSQENDLELWTDRNRDGLRGAEIEFLTNIILGRKQLCN